MGEIHTQKGAVSSIPMDEQRGNKTKPTRSPEEILKYIPDVSIQR